MERISSRFTFVSKWVFPVAWFGFLLFFIGDTLADGTINEDPVFLLAPVFMVIVGFFIMKFLVWDLADAVYDHGTYLVVRRNGKEAQIQLSNGMNVSATSFVNPPRVTLRLVEPSQLGLSVSFSPKSSFSLNPFAKNAVTESLIERAFAARVRRAP